MSEGTLDGIPGGTPDEIFKRTLIKALKILPIESRCRYINTDNIDTGLPDEIPGGTPEGILGRIGKDILEGNLYGVIEGIPVEIPRRTPRTRATTDIVLIKTLKPS